MNWPDDFIDKVICGDCRDILPLIPDGAVDLVVTDPPYGLNYNNGDLAHCWEEALGKGPRGEARTIHQDSPEEWFPLMKAFLKEARRVMRPGSCCCCCCGGGGGPKPIFAHLTLMMDELLDFKQAVVWQKPGIGMGWHYRRSYEFMLIAQKPGAACFWFDESKNVSNIITLPKIIPSAEQHPTEKPIELMQTFIELHSRPGDIVLDPFLGHGTTAVAAKNLGRRFIGIEVEPKYCEIAERRLKQGVLDLGGR